MQFFFRQIHILILFLGLWLGGENQALAQSGNLKLTGEFQNCSNKNNFFLTVKNESATGVFTAYKIKWGDTDGWEDFTQKTASHTYTTKGSFTLQFVGVKAGGGEESTTYTVLNDIAEPKIGLTAGGQGGLCVGDEISFVVSELQSNTMLTKYHLDFGDGEGKDFDGADYPGKTEVTFKHRYLKSSCDYASGEGKIEGLTITVTATNACGKSFNQTAGPYEVTQPLTLSFGLPQEECTENVLDLGRMSTYYPEDCMAVDMEWFLVDEEGREKQISSPYVFHETGKYKIRARAIRNDAECSKGEIDKEITIIPRVDAIVVPLKAEVCEKSDLLLDASGSTGDKKKYTWRVLGGDASKVEFQPNEHAEKVNALFHQYGNYRLELEVNNGCSVDYEYVEVTVKKDPEIVDFKPLPSLCPGKTLNLKGYIVYDWTWAGNPHHPDWSIEGPAGGAEFILESEHAEYPTIKFTKPGDYVLNVKLTGVDCGDGTKLKASRTITIYDPNISGEISHTDLDVCEFAEIVFTNNMQGVNLTTQWKVWNSNGTPASQDSYTMTPEGGGKTTTFAFNKYGDYRITASMSAECGGTKREFDIKVHRAPEVYLNTFPAIVCPETPFLPGGYVDFRPYGNEEQVTFTWEVTGGTEPALLEGENSRNPKITFPKHGDYTITLSINNPTSCHSPSLRVSKALSVSNPQMDLQIIPDRSTICVGEQVIFKNTSTVAVEPEYYWGISPEGYRFIPDGGERSREPVVEFMKSGIYNVTAVVNGICRPETMPFTIIVQEDPEVVLDVIPDQCPGELKLGDDLVHYTWNDSWKSGAESTRRVVWKLTRKPDGADCTPPESLEWNAFHPDLYLNTPGNYTLQVEMKSDATCKGNKLIASRSFTIYDPDLQIDIAPQVGEGVVKLSGDHTWQVVEGSPLSFINRSIGEGLHCIWSVEPANNAVISDKAADAPSITFNRFGTYKVKVDLLGTCKSDAREFTIVVKGVPKFNFNPIADRCDTSDEIDIRDYLTCDSAGSTEIFCNWDIIPSTGYVMSGGTTSDMFYKIKFNTAGDYTLTLKAQAEYGGVQTVSRVVHVLRTAIEAKAGLSKEEGCTTDGLQVVAVNKSEGDLLSYTWSVTPEEGREIVATPEKLTVDFSRPGDYQITLKATNICATDEVHYTVHAYSKPEIAVIGNTNLGTVCEKGYVFKGDEHIGEIKVNNDPLTFIRWSVSPGGSNWENRTGSGDERPDISFEGDKNYVITGEFKNHCQDTVKVHFTLSVDRFVPVTLMKDTVVCARTEPFLLKAEPHGGAWSCAEGTMLAEKEGKNFYFNPWQDESGIFEVTYKRGNGQCLAAGTMNVTVHKLPVVNAGDDLHACLNDLPVELTGITPVDGEWKGPGVRDNRFYPGENGVNTFRLEYWYTDFLTGCPNLDTVNMTVYPLPDPSFVTELKHCAGADALFTPVELGVGNHFSWDFGDGSSVYETADEAAIHVFTNPGAVEVTLTATSAVGCKATSDAKKNVILALPPLADFSLDQESGCGPLEVGIIVNVEQYADTNLRFKWVFGNGLSSDSLEPEPNPLTFAPRPEDTTYSIEFVVSNQCKAETMRKNVAVYSLPHAGFKMMNKYECSPVNVPFVNTSTGSGNSYTWQFGDGTGTSENNPDHDYWAENKTRDYYIELVAQNRCASDTIRDTLTVKPNSIRALFSMDKRRICAGEEICFKNYSSDTSSAIINQFWDFGDGSMDTNWDACHLFTVADTFPVTLTLDNGCGYAVRKDSVIVYAIPRITIESESRQCQGDTFHFALVTDQPLKSVEWDMGDETLLNTQNSFEHIYADSGRFEVTVKVQSATSTGCPAKAATVVENWPKPYIQIIPLDTVACPPFRYQPEIVGKGTNYFKWDYGDGTGLTSEMEHLYVNEGNSILEYNIRAYVETDRGCKREYDGSIRIYNGPHAALDKEISYGRPEKVRFINLSTDYTECIWYLPDGRIVNSPDDQVLVFEEEDTYPLSLAVQNQYGCRDSLYLDYRSFEGGLYFPNTFIPHSTNQNVNRFKGIGMGLKEYKLEIFDLYGNMVWKTTALSMGMPSEGWDGKNKDGKLLPQGIYMWRAEAVFYSEDVWTGKNNRSGKPQTTQGTVLLLRK